nr:hypothetical protein [Tanacetum cinerariifolium]
MSTNEHSKEKVAKEETKVTQPKTIQTILPPTQYPKTPITLEGRVIKISAPVVLELVKTSKEIRPDLDAPVLIDYRIDGKMHLFTHEELQALLNKKEKSEQAVREQELSKPKVMKVAAKLKQYELKKKRYDQYVRTLNNRFKLERIMDIFIHPNTKPVSLVVYRNNDPRNFHVHKEFKFGNLRLSEWDKLNAIIPTKRNKCLKDMMTSLRNKYERLKKIPEELELDESLPLPEQVK